MIYLLDVNVLIALLDETHINYEAAHDWFLSKRVTNWATCPLTENGTIRILGNPNYVAVNADSAMIADQLGTLLQVKNHSFWPDELSILDRSIFELTKLTGHKQVTDLYLAGLAQHNGGKLATFDQSIPVTALVKPWSGVLEVIQAN
ncbi:MAG: PIN domain-containing protein [Lacipirellulaceae bacterium]